MDYTSMKANLAVARGDVPADTVFKNAKIVNVLSGEIHDGDVAVTNGIVVGIGEYSGAVEIDLQGRYLAPAFIDGHIHLESTMLTVHEFARAVVPHGTAGVVADPHEYANVLGIRGIEYVLQAAKHVPVDIFVMASSCVPATHLETSGATLGPEELAGLLQHDGVIGIAEMMNFPGVFLGWDSELRKIELGEPRPIDGHSPGLRGKPLDAYILAGITSDHECTTLEEARDKVRRGMHILIREGTAERNLRDLLPLVTPANARNFSFATDDKHPNGLMDEGHIDHHVREAIAFGIDPVVALQMASYNTATHYRLHRHGAIAPGYWANMVVFDDLNDIRIQEVYRKGECVAKHGALTVSLPPETGLEAMRHSMHVAPFTKDDFAVPAQPGTIKVIEIVPNQIVTKATEDAPTIADNTVVPDPQRDILKLVVIERHNATGNIGVGFVRGFGLKSGAIGSTVAHDAHNIIIAGTNDTDIALAAEELIRMNGGYIVTSENTVVDHLPLPIAGLVSDLPLEEVRARVDRLVAAAAERGCSVPDPFMTLSFLALSPIPELKVTDLGLIDSVKFEATDIFTATPV